MVNSFNYFYALFDQLRNKQDSFIDQFHLVGSRKSGKTLSAVDFLLLITQLEFTMKIYIFRKNTKDVYSTIWEEFLQAIERLEIKTTYISITYRTIKINRTKIYFIGLHDRYKNKVKNLGLASASGCRFAFTLWEERHEFTFKDWYEVKEALRGAHQFIDICTTNPWTISNEYINWCSKIFPFNEKKLIKTGADIKIFEQAINMNKPYKKKKIMRYLFHYSNYQINNLLNESDINQLEQLKTLSPTRARVSCYGLPGVEEGAIYGHCLPYISQQLPNEVINVFSAGIDFGYTKDATALIVVGFTNHYQKVIILKEYFHSNSVNNVFKDGLMQVKEIVYCLKKVAYEFVNIQRFGINVYCDTSNYVMIELLNKFAMEQNLNYLHFLPCKKIEVAFRVGFQLALLEARRVYVLPNCANFLRELSIARWDDKKNKAPLDIDNHTQDAFHYAFIPYMNDIKVNSNSYLFN